MTTEELTRCLDRVVDPELDEPITTLGFVEQVEAERGDVTVVLRLPTFWCAANFAYLMASDVRAALLEAPGVNDVTVVLRDHFAGDEISRGASAGRSFEDAFPQFAQGGLDDLRRRFRAKALLRRQEELIRDLRGSGAVDAAIVRLRRCDVEVLAARGGDPGRVAQRYLAILDEFGLASGPEDPALVDAAGRRVDEGALAARLTEARRTRLGMEVNTTLCRGMLAVRYGEQAIAGERA